MNDTIAAVATPPGTGAVALVRVSGPAAVGVAAMIFRGRDPVEKLPARRQAYGEVVGDDGEVIDDVLLTVFPGPSSYSGEDVVEIACHGGMLVTQRVLEAVFAAGARPAEPGEFSKRAFLNGKMDLTQAEAVMDLISARTSLALRAARGQLEGRLGNRIETLREELLGILAHVEAYIDFPEEDIHPDTGRAIVTRLRSAAAIAGELIATAEQGRILREGLSVVIAGPPNAGKSSLLNVLLGFDRAIVSETPGTTRDTIEEVINLKGVPVRLIDTAGTRESDDAIELEGIGRAERERERADLVLELADGSLPPPTSSSPAGEHEGERRIVVLNKSDLGIDSAWGGGVQVSCVTRKGIDELVDEIVAAATSGETGWGSDLVTVNARHRVWLERARDAALRAAEALEKGASAELAALDVRESMDAVGEIVGKTDIETVLGAIFESFCIGK